MIKNSPTYCNPLSIPDVPSGRWLDTEQTGADHQIIVMLSHVDSP